MFNLMLKIIVDVKRLHLWRVGCCAAAFKYGNGDICVKAFTEFFRLGKPGWAKTVDVGRGVRMQNPEDKNTQYVSLLPLPSPFPQPPPLNKRSKQGSGGGMVGTFLFCDSALIL